MGGVAVAAGHAAKELAKKSLSVESAMHVSEEKDLISGLERNLASKLDFNQFRVNSMVRNWADVKVERRPEKLTREIAERMYGEGLTSEAWDLADIEQRKQMVIQASDIMAQEMMLPEQVRQLLDIQFKLLPVGTKGTTNCFLGKIDGVDALQMVYRPIVTMDEQTLRAGTATENFTTLYHEMTHVLQQVSITEAEPWTENVTYWRQDYESRKPGSVQTFTDYLTGSLEAYAHAQDGLFRKVYDSMQIRGLSLQEEKAASRTLASAGDVSFTGLSGSSATYLTANSLAGKAKHYYSMAAEKKGNESKSYYAKAKRCEARANSYYSKYRRELARA